MRRVLLYGGRIYTMAHGAPSPVEALLLSGDRILATGRTDELESELGANGLRLHLGGRVVVPGFIDAHVHLEWLSFSRTDLNLDGSSFATALQQIAAASDMLAAGKWLRGGGFDANKWERWPTKADLDAVCPSRPVALASRDYHTYWVNSCALAHAGISANTPDPVGGHILRDGTGEPVGLLRERAQSLIDAAMPPRSLDETVAALRVGLQAAAVLGLTGIHDMDGATCFRALQKLHQSDELIVRTVKYLPASSIEAMINCGLTSGYGDSYLRIGGLKVFSDGSLGSQTAAMLTDYHGLPGYRGLLTYTGEELSDLVGTAARAGIACAIHAIGDAANRLTLDAFSDHAPVSATLGLRQRIEHAQHVDEKDVHRFAAQGVVASVQPLHLPSDREVAERYLGARVVQTHVWSSLRKAGARIALGSDAPVVLPDPLKGFYAAVFRRAGGLESSWYPEERLTPTWALHGYTLGAAYAGGTDHLQGSLEPGKLADLAFLSRDILSGHAEDIDQARVEATWVGGRAVYGGW